MNKIEKVKKIITISLGFALATYLIMSGMAILDQENQQIDTNTTKETHSK